MSAGLWTREDAVAESQAFGPGCGHQRFTEELYGAVAECFNHKNVGNTVRLFAPGMGEAVIHLQHMVGNRIGFSADALVFPSHAADKPRLLSQLKREVRSAFNRVISDRKLLAADWDEVTLSETDIKPGRPAGAVIGSGRMNADGMVSEPED